MLSDSTKNNKIKNTPEFLPNADIAIFDRFLRRIKLRQRFESLPDLRQQKKVRYPHVSLLMWAFSLCSFRLTSKNALNTKFKGLEGDSLQSFTNFLGIEQNSLPDSTVVDDYLRTLNPESFNDFLFQIFEWGHKSKLFYNHAADLFPYNSYTLGGDGFHLHTYSKPHSTDEKGNNICPYCLPRKCNKGTPKEKLYWVHVKVTFTIIFPGLTLPIYVHPLKARHINALEENDEDFKQECELHAFKTALPLIRARFPRLHFTFLGDSLYANSPCFNLCKDLKMDYLIVRKEKVLKKLGEHCNELEKTKLYQQSYTVQQKIQEGDETITRTAKWFNHEVLFDGTTTHVLRFEEQRRKGDKKISGYKGEWLSSKSIRKNSSFKTAEQGRSRWNHEDMHNTMNNRGFAAQHDLARADPNLQLVWKLMMFLAFSIFELFSCSVIARKIRRQRSWWQLARSMLEELFYLTWNRISCSEILQKPKVQFRFLFDTS